jgi:hypothetical protein
MEGTVNIHSVSASAIEKGDLKPIRIAVLMNNPIMTTFPNPPSGSKFLFPATFIFSLGRDRNNRQ